MACKKRTKAEETAAGKYSGVAINRSDDDQVSVKLEKERTETLNNNPRNTDEEI